MYFIACGLSCVFCRLCIVECVLLPVLGRMYFGACAFRLRFVDSALMYVLCRVLCRMCFVALCIVAYISSPVHFECVLSPVHFECFLSHVHFESVLSPVHCRMSFLSRGGSQSRSLIGVVPGHPLVSARHCFRRRLHDSIADQAS